MPRWYWTMTGRSGDPALDLGRIVESAKMPLANGMGPWPAIPLKKKACYIKQLQN